MLCPACNSENIDGARFCAKCGALIPTDAPPAEVDPLIGQTVGGRYTITKVLGEGGMGRVYEAERHIAGVKQRVAVKTLHSHLSSDAAIVARFHRECGTVAQLRHPNTIKVEDFGQTADGTLYIAMEFVDGVSVAKELEDHGPMQPERVERIMGQVCGSLAEAHKQGVIHRDLKPENVVITNIGEDTDFVKVLDFGIAARKDSTDAAKEQKLTQQGMVLGTPPYMSPEQFMGKELDARSDIYSLGVMVYEMMTGKLPFEANTPWEWATCHMTAQPHPFDDMPTMSDVPGKMKHAVLRALSKKPEDRQATVREFFEDMSGGFADMSTTGGRLSSGTGVMAPHAPSGGPSKPQQTEIGGLPAMDAVSGMPPAPAPGGQPQMTPPGMAYPAPPPVMAPSPQDAPNRTPLFIGAGVAALVVLAAGGAILSGMFHPSRGGKLDGLDTAPAASVVVPNGSASGPAVVTTVAPKTTATATTTAVSALSGEAACEDAIRRANNGDVVGANAANARCSGPQSGAANNAIKAAIPTVVRREAFDNKCAQARNTAAMGGKYGVNINVDSTYPSCRGK